MNVVNQLCGSCAGTGTVIDYVPETKFGESEFMTARRTERKCGCCNGKGYIEYAMFTIKEAEQIMKVCGLERTEE